MPRPTCNTCWHFFPEGPEDGFCRRFPPVSILKAADLSRPEADPLRREHIMSAWPPVRGSAYCGEHLPLELKANQEQLQS